MTEKITQLANTLAEIIPKVPWYLLQPGAYSRHEGVPSRHADAEGTP